MHGVASYLVVCGGKNFVVVDGEPGDRGVDFGGCFEHDHWRPSLLGTDASRDAIMIADNHLQGEEEVAVEKGC